jgi:hypothetical protein
VTSKTVLATSTGEPYQPVRLTYSINSRAWARTGLKKLRCVTGEAGGLTVWLTDEARELLGTPDQQFELFGQRVIVGVVRFPSAKSMTLQVRSYERAKAIAILVRAALGVSAQAVRMRVVNRLFAAEEKVGELEELDRWLDRDVVRVDPDDRDDADEDEEIRRAVAGREDKLQALEEFLSTRRRPSSRHDVPLVEDFPLYPEEESDDLRDLRTLLDLRFMRALRRWQGEDVTLRDVIEELVQDMQAPGQGS